MKQRKLGKRIAALLLTAVMLLSYVPVNIWAVDSASDIKAIKKPTGMAIVEDYDDYFGENWLDKLSLPGEVSVTLANGQATEVPVTWDTLF